MNEPTYQDLIDELKKQVDNTDDYRHRQLKQDATILVHEETDDDQICEIFAEASLQNRQISHKHSRGRMSFSDAMRDLVSEALYHETKEELGE